MNEQSQSQSQQPSAPSQAANVEGITEQMQGLTVQATNPHANIRGGQRQYPQAAFLTMNQPSSSSSSQQPQTPTQNQQWRPLSTFPTAPLPPPQPIPQQLPETNQQTTTTNQQQSSPPKQTKHRIDPNQMPNPTTTSSGDNTVAPETYVTLPQPIIHGQQQQQLPPLPPSTRPSVAYQDTGNCSPRFIRMTSYTIPANSEMISTINAPFGCIISPLSDVSSSPQEERPPLIETNEEGPIRCGRCRAYISPFVDFQRGGQTYRCRLCGMINEVPEFYFSPLQPNGLRADISSRPELTKGSVEYSVQSCKMYCSSSTKQQQQKQQQQQPIQNAICFVLDVSEQALVSGYTAIVSNCIKQLISTGIPTDGRKIGFITYNSTVHFWDVSKCPPRMLIVSDIDSMFVPSINGFFATYNLTTTTTTTTTTTNEEIKKGIEHLLTNIPSLASKQPISQRLSPPAVGAALQAACLSMASFGCIGKIILFNSSLPTSGPGAMRERDDIQCCGTDKEKTLLSPQTPFYQTLAKQCSSNKIGVDIFISSPREYSDIATIGEISRLTGGQIYFYPHFEVSRDCWKFESDLRRNLTRETGYDASLRVRTSAGLSINEYIGHFSLPSNNDNIDIDIPIIDSDKAIAVSFNHDEKLNENHSAIIQCAMLYSTSNGERRVRVHTISLPVSSSYPNVFRSLDCDAIVAHLARSSVQLIRKGTQISSVSASIGDQIVECLASYRKYCTTSPSAGQLILPESIRLLPLYFLSMTKLPLLRTEVRSDIRSFAMLGVSSEQVLTTMLRLYPRVYSLNSIIENQNQSQNQIMTIPPTTRLSGEFISPNGVYLIDDGLSLHVWTGALASKEIISIIFGSSDALAMTPAALSQAFSTALQSGDLKISGIVNLIGLIAQQRMHNNFAITCSSQSADVSDSLVVYKLQLEDKQPGAMSYVDFLCHLHRQIALKLADPHDSYLAMSFAHQ